MANALSFLADPEYYSTMGDVAGNALMTAWNRAKNGEAMLTGKPIVNSLREQISAPPEQMGMDWMGGGLIGATRSAGKVATGLKPWAEDVAIGTGEGSSRLFDTMGLENKGRDLIQSKAEEYAQKLKDAGVNVLDVQHSGSLAGPSSYIKIHGQPDLRISGHDKGVIGSQSVINIGSDAQFNDILSQLPKTVRKATPEDYARIEQQKIENEYPRWIASADKKLAKGKALTNSEQEAITWRNGQATGEQPWAAQAAKTEFELAHETAQRNAALPIEQGGLGLPANNTAMDRAKAMGYQSAPGKTQYHGARGEIVGDIDPSRSDMGFHTGTLEQADDRLKAFGNRYVSMSDVFGGGTPSPMYPEGANIIPLMARKNANMLTLKDVGSFHADAIAPQLERKGLLKKGEGKAIEKAIDKDWQLRKVYDPQMRQVLEDNYYNGIKYQNTQEGAGTSYAFTDPSQIRSRFAAFDPMQRNSANLLAGGLVGAVGLNALSDLYKQDNSI